MLDELSIVTRRDIYPRTIRDNFFMKNSPLLAYIRGRGMIRSFQGGSTIQQQYLFDAVNSQAYEPGQSFVATRKQLIASNNFYPKFSVAILMDSLENLEVVQGSNPNNVANLLNVQVGSGIASISARLGLTMYYHGQNVTSAGSFGATIEDRSAQLNGLVEALNDGVTPGFDGNVWTSYGGQRRSEVGTALNSTPRWMGNPDGSVRRLTADELYAFYNGGQNGPTIGTVRPDLILITKGVNSSVRSLLVGQQPSMQQEKDPIWGLMGGIKFEDALIMVDDYAPGVQGRNVAYGNNSTLGKTVTLPGAGAVYNAISPEFASTLPAASTVLTVGDTIWALNSTSWLFDVAASPLFAMGFSGWAEHPLSTDITGRIHFAGNIRCLEPRLNRAGYGLAILK